MNSDIFRKFIDSNKSFFLKKREGRDNRRGKILVDLQITDVFIASSIMQMSLAVSDVLDRDIIVISAMRAKGDLIELIKSYNPMKVISAKFLIASGFLFNIAKIIKLAMNINTGDDLVSLKIQDMPIGMHIYDLILRRMGLSSIDKLSLQQRVYLVVELSFFYSILGYINRHNISYAILPDNVYRQGLIFEIVKKKVIPSISAIDINGMSMHKYTSAEDYIQHCRTPDMDIVVKIMNTPGLYSDANKYLLYRTSGQEQQHDIVRAYSKEKMEIHRTDLINTYNLHPDKKIVLVMAHVFSDAPHAYPGMLFKDYEDWLIKTCIRLSQNQNVNFLVKEHPSASLYKEDGLVDIILGKHGFKNKVIAKNINTKSLFGAIDVIVTCGGTAGMEFPCFGIPVLVAAKPPYASFTFISRPDTESEYYEEIDKIHLYERLSDKDIKLARVVLYTIQNLMKVKKNQIGLGSQEFFMGCEFDMNLFLKEMIQDCIDGSGYDNLIESIELLIDGNHKNLIDYQKLINQ